MPAADQANASQADPPGLTVSVSVSASQHLIIEVLRRPVEFTQYLSDHFLNQLRYWGIHPSFAFVEEPETNGVVERWNRTLKEQAVYGRVFRNLAEVRAAVAAFVERYNQCWRLEKLAYRTPSEAREQRGGPRFSDRLLRWSPDPTGGIWNATQETELPG